MKENIPKIETSKIIELIEREFGVQNKDTVWNYLNTYSGDSEFGRNRIFAGIIKLSLGDIQLIKSYTEQAKSDFRDIIAWAESPNLSKDPFGILNSKDKKYKEEINKADNNQYKHWLNKKIGTNDLFRILKIGLDTTIRGKGISIKQAIEETNFRKLSKKIESQDLIEVIKLFPEIIDEWMAYSEDKRTSGGWYLKRNNVIGNLEDMKSERIFKNAEEAVANYVLLELIFWSKKIA